MPRGRLPGQRHPRPLPGRPHPLGAHDLLKRGEDAPAQLLRGREPPPQALQLLLLVYDENKARWREGGRRNGYGGPRLLLYFSLQLFGVEDNRSTIILMWLLALGVPSPSPSSPVSPFQYTGRLEWCELRMTGSIHLFESKRHLLSHQHF
ncbi:unnamed protein product [Heterosigma akashiwo]